MNTKLKKKLAVGCIVLLIASIALTTCSAIMKDKNPTKPDFTATTDEELMAMIPDYSQYVTLGDYSNLTYELDDEFAVTDEDIHYGLINALKDIAIKTEITNRPAQKGDTVNVSYKGTVDGKTFKGSETGKDGNTIIIGYDRLVDDFDSKLIGMSVGKTKTIEITYPKDYGNEDINGKTAQFEVTMNSIYTYELPELTDELVRDNSKFETVEEIKNACADTLMQTNDRDRKNATYDAIVDELMAISTYNGLPDDEINALVDESIASIEDYAKSANLDVSTVIKNSYDVETIEECRESLMSQTKEFFKIKITLCTLAKQEGIVITLEDFEEYKSIMIEKNNLSSTDKLLDYFKEEDLLFNCLLQKIQEWLLENTTKRN